MDDQIQGQAAAPVMVDAAQSTRTGAKPTMAPWRQDIMTKTMYQNYQATREKMIIKYSDQYRSITVYVCIDRIRIITLKALECRAHFAKLSSTAKHIMDICRFSSLPCSPDKTLYARP